MPLPNIEIRSKKLRGGRASLAPKTESRKERKDRREMLKALIRQGRTDLVERVRKGELDIVDVHQAFDGQRLDELRPLSLGAGTTVNDALDHVLLKIGGEASDGTVRVRKSIAKQIRERFGKDGDADRLIADIPAADIEKFLFEPKPTKPWGRTRKESVRQLGMHAWDVAIKAEREQSERTHTKPRITVNPWREIKIRGTDESVKRVPFLTRAQWLEVEKANADTPHLTLVALGALAGLRVGEQVHLRMELDIDLSKRLIRIQPRKGSFPWKPKTKRSVREVPINDRLAAIIDRHIALGFAGKHYLITLPRQDQPISEKTAGNWTEVAFNRAGVRYGRTREGLTNHSLRHTFCSWLAQEDVQLKKIAELVGDKVETVDRFYAHLTPRDLEKTVRILDVKLESEKDGVIQ